MARVKIRIRKPGKLVLVFAVIALIVAAAVFLPKILGGDKVQKEIEALENQKVDIMSKTIALYQGETELAFTDQNNPITIKPGQFVKFKVVYQYQPQVSKTIKTYPVESGLTVTPSDTASATVLTDGCTLQIPNTITTQTDFSVTVKYKGLDDKTYYFRITPDAVSDPATTPEGDTEPEGN